MFVRYLGTSRSGRTFRNTELFRIVDDKIRDVEVYFGSLPGVTPD